MARKKLGNKPQQKVGRDFMQTSEYKSSFAQSSERSTGAGAGNTGEGVLASLPDRRKPRGAARGAATNFA